jgi:hypothetical protein
MSGGNDPFNSDPNPYASPGASWGSAIPPAPHSGKAIAALVLGCVGLVAWCCPLLGLAITVPGLILGIIALKSDRRGMALAGIVLCSLGLVLSAVNAGWGAYMVISGQHPLLQPAGGNRAPPIQPFPRE